MFHLWVVVFLVLALYGLYGKSVRFCLVLGKILLFSSSFKSICKGKQSFALPCAKCLFLGEFLILTVLNTNRHKGGYKFWQSKCSACFGTLWNLLLDWLTVYLLITYWLVVFDRWEVALLCFNLNFTQVVLCLCHL